MTETCIYYRQCIQMCACMDPGGGGGGGGGVGGQDPLKITNSIGFYRNYILDPSPLSSNWSRDFIDCFADHIGVYALYESLATVGRFR